MTDEQFIASRDLVVNWINRTNGRISELANTSAVASIRSKIADAARWFQAALERYYGGKTDAAMESIGVASRLLMEANNAINALRPEDRVAAQAQQQAQSGASFSYQVGQTVGELTAPLQSAITEPIASAIETVSPSAAAAVRSSGWALPAMVGLGLFLLFRR